jgi:tetratricopeptide (TPR) repeat protein
MEDGLTSSRLILALLLFIAFAAPASGQTNASDLFDKGVALYNENNFTGSLDAYEKAIEIDPSNAEAWNNMGIDLGILGKYDEALYAFREAAQLNSSYAEAWYNMGAIFDIQGKYISAIQAYGAATRINPSYQKAWEAKNYDINIIGIQRYLEINHDIAF